MNDTPDIAALVAGLRIRGWGKDVADTLNRWTREREQSADALESLARENTIQQAYAVDLKAAKAKAEAERDALRGENERHLLTIRNMEQEIADLKMARTIRKAERDALADKLALVRAEISKTGEWAPLSDRVADILEGCRRD